MKHLTTHLILVLGLCWFISVEATEVHIHATDDLQQIINQSSPGDHLVIQPGIYSGNFTITKPLILTGQKGAIIDAQGVGSAITIQADNVTINKLFIRHWGDNLTTLDAGIFITKSANAAVINQNRLYGDSFGIWVDAAPDVKVTNNQIQGNNTIRSQDRGNGIHLSGVSGASIKNNVVWHTRDGIYIENSHGNELIGNFLHDLRYGIHYMYSYRNKIINNHTRGTRTGYALMQSKYLTVLNNRSENDLNYGILMNFITHSSLINNRIEGTHSTEGSTATARAGAKSGREGKAIFIYNSLFNKITNNSFSHSDLGIHLTAGSEKNQLWGNAFISNREQVKYVSNRKQDWSHQNRGNYWSDYLGWDMDGDGIGDTLYEPNDSIDKLMWKFPIVKTLLNSPSIVTLRWVQRHFPVLKSPGIIDSAPLMEWPSLSANSHNQTSLDSL
ncbi:MAG: nitrous oxide reductase family maturation protein NosD [Candidatus Polarisedimenticolaceae bacterium]|nr:nitrous oxide reductase family maturation protein NosD [Candidatus Polarisedimenticolaceae bacterium]